MSTVCDDDVVDYANWTDQNVKARAEFFANLKLDSIAKDLYDLHPKKKSRSNNSKILDEPSRKSTRFLRRKSPISYDDEKLTEVFEASPKNFETALIECSTWRNDSLSDKHLNLSKMSSVINFGSMIKRTPRSFAIHPCSPKILLAAGNSQGQISLLIYDNENSSVVGSQVFNVEDLGYIDHLQLDNSSVTISGTIANVKSLDINRRDAGFIEIYRSSEKVSTTGIHSSSSELWMSQDDGSLCHLDRGSGKTSKYQVGTCCLSCMAVHDNYLAVGSKHHVKTHSALFIWDRRFLKPRQTLASTYMAPYAQQMSFNPKNPAKLLVKASDQSIRTYIFDQTSLEMLKSVPNERVYFSPIWHPSSADHFFVGGCDQKLLQYCFENDELNSRNILSTPHHFSARTNLLAAHQSLPLIAGLGISTGAVSLFKFDS